MTIHAACRGCGETIELEPVQLLVSPMAIPHGHKWATFVRKHTTCTSIPSKTEMPTAPTAAVVRPELEAAPPPSRASAPIIPPLQSPPSAPVLPPPAPAAAEPAGLPPGGAGLLLVGPNAEEDIRKKTEGQ